MRTTKTKSRKGSKITSKGGSRVSTSNMSEILKAIDKEKKWLKKKRGASIELYRVVNGKPLSVFLHYRESSQKFEISFPNYVFESKVSYFAPKQEERRLCRNKVAIASVIKVLRKSALWRFISNKDFVVVNESNKRVSRTRIRRELDKILLG